MVPRLPFLLVLLALAGILMTTAACLGGGTTAPGATTTASAGAPSSAASISPQAPPTGISPAAKTVQPAATAVQPAATAVSPTTAGVQPATGTIPADWRTVTIHQSLSMRMPPNWTTKVNPDGIVILDPPVENPQGAGAVVIEILPGTFASFLAATNVSTGTLNRDLFRQTASTTIGGFPATVTYGGCCGGGGQYVFVEAGGLLYKFGLYGPEPQPGQGMMNEAIFRQILSSARLPG